MTDVITSTIDIENNQKKSPKLIAPEESKSLLRDVLTMALLTFLLIVGMKNVLGEPRWIPSSSMSPTLVEGDRLIVEKVTPVLEGFKRGDIVVFYPPSVELRHDLWAELTRMTGFFVTEDSYIKRIIGVPGDTYQVVEGVGVFINGELLDEPYKAEISNKGDCGYDAQFCGPLTIPEGHYFVMGDNRNNSIDGRFFGLLPQERIIGKAFVLFWPLNRTGPLF